MASDLIPSAPMLSDDEEDTFYANRDTDPSVIDQTTREYDVSAVNYELTKMSMEEESKRIQPFSENQLLGLLMHGKTSNQYQDIDHFIDQFLLEMQKLECDDPTSIISNQKLAEQNSLQPNVEISYLIKSSIYCKFDHSRYPMGRQKCNVSLGSSSFGAIFVLEGANVANDKNEK